MADRLQEAFQASQEVERPSNLQDEPKPRPAPVKREPRTIAPKPAPAPAVSVQKAKVIYWTTRARADQLRDLQHLMAKLRLQDAPRSMTDLTIEALDMLLEKYRDV